jgi:hypothetical protein
MLLIALGLQEAIEKYYQAYESDLKNDELTPKD